MKENDGKECRKKGELSQIIIPVCSFFLYFFHFFILHLCNIVKITFSCGNHPIWLYKGIFFLDNISRFDVIFEGKSRLRLKEWVSTGEDCLMEKNKNYIIAFKNKKNISIRIFIRWTREYYMARLYMPKEARPRTELSCDQMGNGGES